jgi:hypothetical protein
MATLDNLVVTTALPVIRKDLHAIDREPRVDRQRVHADVRRAAADRRRARRPLRPAPHARVGLVIFTALCRRGARADCRRSDRARAAQGVGGAIVTR